MAGTTGAATRTRGRSAALGGFLAALSVLATGLPPAAAAAAGDPVPLPHLRPDHGVSPADVTTAAIAPGATLPAYSPDSRFTRDQQIALARINAYFNSFSTMEGQFIQFGPTGDQSEGVFFMSRPGRDPVSLCGARASRRDRRRQFGCHRGRARQYPAALSAVEDAAPLPVVRSHRFDLGPARRFRPRRARPDLGADRREVGLGRRQAYPDFRPQNLRVAPVDRHGRSGT